MNLQKISSWNEQERVLFLGPDLKGGETPFRSSLKRLSTVVLNHVLFEPWQQAVQTLDEPHLYSVTQSLRLSLSPSRLVL